MEEDKIIDQSELAQSVAEKIEYDFLDNFLVKPLDVIRVTKQFTKPVSEKPSEKDKNGVDAVDYDEVETEVKEVDSDFRKGVVLKIPYSYSAQLNDDKINYLPKISVGDIVVYRDRSGSHFDLLKDSKLLKYYEIIAVVK